MTAAADPLIRTEVLGQVLVLTFNRPAARNAVNRQMAEALGAALDELDGSEDLAAAVVTGAGGTFCSGRDLKASLQGDDPFLERRGFAGITEYGSRKPLLAAVEGYAVGGGLEIVLACDIVIAARSAQLGLPEVQRGRVAGAGGLFRLPDRVPYSVAMEMALTGDPVTADRAAQLGLVNHVVDDGSALPAAVELAQRIARNGPLAVTTSKQVIQASRDWPSTERFDRQRPIAKAIRESEDAREGARAFAEKRPPVWRNL
jgi:enoyl-CoA hydratase